MHNAKIWNKSEVNYVITDAPLAPNPMYEGPSLCRPELYKLKCVRVCPTKAISTPLKSLKCTVGGRVFEYSKTDHVRCMYGILALVKGSGSRGHVDISSGPGNLGHLLEAREQQNPPGQTLYGVFLRLYNR